jgi:hypothetical protein
MKPGLALMGVIIIVADVHTHGSEPQFWINELHYDNSGTDVDEFVEVIAPAGFAELAAVRLTLYNGGDGAPYGTGHLLSSFTRGKTSEGFTVYSKAISGQQNGAPDGISLDYHGEVLHFISYEGVFTATSGPASGMASGDIGIFEADTSPVGGSLGLSGSGSGPNDFVWSALEAATPGGFNVGQRVIPEPRTAFLLFAGAACLFVRKRSGRDGHLRECRRVGN